MEAIAEHTVFLEGSLEWFVQGHTPDICVLGLAWQLFKELHKIKQTDLVCGGQIPEHAHIRHIFNNLLGYLRALAEVIS